MSEHVQPIAPRPEFRAVSEADVMAALGDPDPQNPIALEVARLIEGYTANFAAYVQRIGFIPEAILRSKAQFPIEAVAMRLTTEAIREELAKVGHPSSPP